MEKERKRKARRRKGTARNGDDWLRKRMAWRRKGNEECRVVKQPKKIEKEKTVS